jgi:hypothetical protein
MWDDDLDADLWLQGDKKPEELAAMAMECNSALNRTLTNVQQSVVRVASTLSGKAVSVQRSVHIIIIIYPCLPPQQQNRHTHTG